MKKTKVIDNVDAAIAACDKPLLLGRIDSMDQLFETVGYRVRATPGNGNQPDLPWPENKTFTLISHVNGTVWWDFRRHLCLACRPAAALMDAFIAVNGRVANRNSDTEKERSALSSFEMIPWPKKGVALVLAKRDDNSSFGTWVGFIDLKNVPTYKPKPVLSADEPEPVRGRSLSM